MTSTDPGASDSTEQLSAPEINNSMDATMPILPSGLKLPQPLKTETETLLRTGNDSDVPGTTTRLWPDLGVLMKNSRR